MLRRLDAEDILFAINDFPILNQYAICEKFNLDPETFDNLMKVLKELAAVKEVNEIPSEYQKGPFYQISPLWRGQDYEAILINLFPVPERVNEDDI